MIEIRFELKELKVLLFFSLDSIFKFNKGVIVIWDIPKDGNYSLFINEEEI